MTLPDVKLVPVFDRQPWPNKSVLVKDTEFAALRDDVGRWWDVPFSKVKDFFAANNNEIDGKFFFIDTKGKVFTFDIETIKNIDKGCVPAVEKWDGTQLCFIKANDSQSWINITIFFVIKRYLDISEGDFERLDDRKIIPKASEKDRKCIINLMTDGMRKEILKVER